MPNIPLSKLRDCLLDIAQPIAQRTHAAFLLRTRGDEEAVAVLSEALRNKADTPLMRHELAYILGQVQNALVCPMLTSILADETDDILVRHESAEALGAIGHADSLEVLQRFASHEAPEISETCQIAIDLIEWRKQNENVDIKGKGGYLSVDPAPSLLDNSDKDVELLRAKLMDTSASLFHRYRAMFSLRNLNTDAAAVALLDGFQDSSALFRHEVAYVLGQMQRASTTDGLIAVLRKKDEHRMVRHEAAEALGAIGGEVAEGVLQEYLNDGEQVVEESCHVALDTIEYWAAGEFDQL
jgi:deoxyhypusine monooxygenase